MLSGGISEIWAVYLTTVLGGVLVASAVLKLGDRSASSQAVGGFTVIPVRLRPLVGAALAPAELTLGLLLVVSSGIWSLVVAWVVAALMLAFCLLVGVTLLRGERPGCHCFGAITDAPIGARTLVRNTLLLAVALLVALGARPAEGVPGAVRAVNADARLALLALLAGTVATVVLWTRQTRLARRLDSLDARPETLPVASAPAPQSAPIPTGVLADPDGYHRQLAEMSRDKARLLVFVSPSCATCHHLAPLLPDWQKVLGAELDVTVVSLGTPEETAAAYPVLAGQAWTDPAGTHELLGVPGTPSAVLLGTNGEVGAGPAAGLEAITELVGVIVESLTVNLLTGAAQQSQAPIASREERAPWLPEIDRAVPELHVVTEDGRVTSYAAALEEIAGPEGVVTVAWSTDCGHCLEILDPLREASADGGVVLVVDEDVAAVRAQGITAPVLRVMPPGNAVGAVGVPGTPAAVPVREGRVVALGGIGGPHTLEVLAEHGSPGVRWIDQVSVG